MGLSLTFTATVSSASGTGETPTGSVEFFIDGTSVGSFGLNSRGSATYTTAALSVGSHTITASYAGDGGFLASSSTELRQMVGEPIAWG